MKKLKQITALIGVIALAGLYVSTLVLALIGSEQCINLLKAAVYATIVHSGAALGIFLYLPFNQKRYEVSYDIRRNPILLITDTKKPAVNNTKNQ